jgi:hypothetical protein
MSNHPCRSGAFSRTKRTGLQCEKVGLEEMGHAPSPLIMAAASQGSPTPKLAVFLFLTGKTEVRDEKAVLERWH